MGWNGPRYSAGASGFRSSHVAQIREFFEQRFDPNELATLADLLGRLPEAAGDGEDCSPPPE